MMTTAAPRAACPAWWAFSRRSLPQSIHLVVHRQYTSWYTSLAFSLQGMMDCLYADCTPMITDCVMAELEKLGQKYRVALKIAKVGAAGRGWVRLGAVGWGQRLGG